MVVFFLRKETEKMKRIFLLFLLCFVSNAHCAELLSFGVAICGFGMYKYNGKCVSQQIHQDGCKKIDGHNSYLLTLDLRTFSFTELGTNKCQGAYSIYNYPQNRLLPVQSTGAFLYGMGQSGKICGFGQYHLNGKCYDFDASDATGNCRNDYHLMGSHDASFMSKNKEKPWCNGDYTLYNFVSGIDGATTFANARMYPIYHGTLLLYGPPIGTVADMKSHDCSVNGEHYYQLGITDQGSFAFPILGMCDDGYSKFIIDKNCHYINSDADIAENMICGVLCEKPEYVYTNSGVCSERGYCSNDGKHRRLYVGLPNGGGSYSYPLYASKTTTPSLNFQFMDANGGAQTCYVNLVPPDAIKHFVTEKPNPLRLGYPRTWTMGDGTEYSTETLITID